MKIGLMLGGGGAKGAYQVGVLKALDEKGLLSLIEVFSGSSIGALNSYFYLASEGVENVIDAWRYGISKNPFSLAKKSELSFKETAFQIINEMAEQYTDSNILLKSNKDLYVSLTKIEKPSLAELIKRWNWESEIIHLNKKKNPLDYVISSSTIPIILGFSEIKDKTYVDGGLTNNNPFEPLINSGCDLIFSCSLDLFHSIDKIDNENVVIVNLTSKQALPRTPIRSYLAVIDFSEKSFEEKMEMGYVVAKKMIEYIIELGIIFKKDNKYYLNDLTLLNKRVNIPKEIDVLVKNMDLEDKGEAHGDN